MSPACSTTGNLPAGEVLYTGIAGIAITDRDSIRVDDELLDRIDEALACPPNNALLGSSSVRTPVPLGLWIYNANVNGKGPFRRWMMNLAAKPVLISAVKPETRTLIVRNILRDHGYFGGTAGYELLPDRKDSLKAKVRYEVTLGEPYVIDTIEWMRMQHRGDTLLRLNEADRLVSAGDLFNTRRLEAERQRLAAIMQNNGYFYFRPEYIVYQADSTLSPHRTVSLRAGLRTGVPRSVLRPWKTGDISIILKGYDGEHPTDSICYNGVRICYEGKLRVRPRILYGQLKFGRGEPYSLAKQAATQSAINALDIFRFTEFRYTPKDTLPSCDTMNVTISALYDYPLNGTFEVRATSNDNRYAGPGASLNLTRRNAFGGGEVLTASLYGSYEWNTGDRKIRNTGVINNFEAGVKGSILFPRLMLPQVGRRAYNFSASSLLDLDVSVLNRARYYTTLRIAGSLAYEFVPTSMRRHTFTPFRLAYNRLQATTPAFDSIVALNPSLSQSLADQFIPSIGYTYTLDNSPVRRERSRTWWQLSVSEAGNIVSGATALFGRRGGRNVLFGTPCAQFLKVTTELRYNHYIDRNQRLAMRIGAGIVYSYGTSAAAPYNERFHVGGANSIRAFTVRSIGPGRFRPDAANPYAYIDQNGDWKLEGNIEYRGRLVGRLAIAVFVDAGNVWLLREDATRPGGTFRWKHALRDIALGTGLGFRYDMDMLVVRLDIGYALHFPYDTRTVAAGERRRYFNAPSFRDGLGIHVALGYPF
jgi:outer membrane protein assembly factor BamA